MNYSVHIKISRDEFNALSDNVFDRLSELTDYPKMIFDRDLRAAMIEQWRGRNAARTGAKSEFVKAVLNIMMEKEFISSWEKIASKGRSDYRINLKSGRIAVLESKGSMDGNSATILERPPYADELILWTITTNPMSDVIENIWSGIHTRLSPEHIVNGKRVDVVMAWDHLGSSVQLCPALADLPEVRIGEVELPPPCLYVLPHELPIIDIRNPVKPRDVSDSEFARSVCECFGVPYDFVGKVEFELGQSRDHLARRTTISFGNQTPRISKMTPLRRDLTGYRKAVALEKQEMETA